MYFLQIFVPIPKRMCEHTMYWKHVTQKHETHVQKPYEKRGTGARADAKRNRREGKGGRWHSKLRAPL